MSLLLDYHLKFEEKKKFLRYQTLTRGPWLPNFKEVQIRDRYHNSAFTKHQVLSLRRKLLRERCYLLVSTKLTSGEDKHILGFYKKLLRHQIIPFLQ